MADQLYVVNLALAHLGEPTADDLDPNDMREATRKVLRHLDQARDAVLQRQGWLDALAYDTLTVSAEPGNWKYAYRYDLPADALRIWTVDGCAKWERGSVLVGGAARKVIWASASTTLNISYAAVRPYEALGAALIDAIGLEVAARACQPVNGDVARADKLKQRADQAVMLALGIDGMEEGGQDEMIQDTLHNLRQSFG